MKEQRKGMAIISWIMLVIFTVMVVGFIITWARGQAATMTEQTINYAEGRMDCQQVRLANYSHDCATNEIELKNPGMLHIKRVSVRIDDMDTEIKAVDILAQGDPQTITVNSDFNKAIVIPIIESGEDLLGCTDKAVSIYC